MPELPEVETVKRSLSQHLIGRTITKVEVFHEKNIKYPEAGQFIKELTGKTFEKVNRRGKYLLFSLAQDLTLVVHLRMTGQFVYQESHEPVKKHTHIIITLDNGHQLRFVDQRRFGCLWLVKNEEVSQVPGLCSLGIEPLCDGFTVEHLRNLLKGKKTRIKTFLLNQVCIAGIGNIYADEILYHSKLHPERRADSLNEAETARLCQAVKSTLAEAVEHRGTSFSDYVDGRGEKGSHQHHLNVYQRSGKTCPRCGGMIARSKVGSRSAYYCPHCQK